MSVAMAAMGGGDVACDVGILVGRVWEYGRW